jgi:hypothetical protein
LTSCVGSVYDGTYYIVLDGQYYIGQYLVIVDLTTGQNSMINFNPDDNDWIVPSLTWNPMLSAMQGIGYAVQHGNWQMVSVDPSNGEISGFGEFAEVSTDMVCF